MAMIHQVFLPNLENNLEPSILPKNGLTLFVKKVLDFDGFSIYTPFFLKFFF
jgi:hypothetical protein